MKRKTKKMLKGLGVGLLVVGLAAGVATGAKALIDKSNEEIKTINPRFSVGGLDVETGKYVEREDTLYTKTAFECQGLEISLTFDNDINYQVFFYDEVGNFVESTETLDSKYTFNYLDNIEITHARVMIIPQWSNLEETDDKTIEEQKVINWKNKSSFVNQLTIKVNKEQVEYTNLLTNYEVVENTALTSSAFEAKEGYDYICMENINDYDKLLICFKEVPSIPSGFFTFYSDLDFSDGTSIRQSYSMEKFIPTSTDYILVVDDLENGTSYDDVKIKNLYIFFSHNNLLGIYEI